MEKKKKQPPIVPEFKIPRCCREGWESCPHRLGKPKKKPKRNIGL